MKTTTTEERYMASTYYGIFTLSEFQQMEIEKEEREIARAIKREEQEPTLQMLIRQTGCYKAIAFSKQTYVLHFKDRRGKFAKSRKGSRNWEKASNHRLPDTKFIYWVSIDELREIKLEELGL